MLKTIVESLDGMSEELHELYDQTDDGYVLKVDDIDSHPDVVRLKRAYEAEKDKRKETEAKLKDIPKDFDKEQWEKVKSGKAKEEDLIALRQQLEAERDEWKGKAQNLEQQTYQLTVSQQLDEALKNAGVTNPAFNKAARALLNDGVTLKDGRAIVDTDMGPMPLAEHVKRWASSEGAAFVEASKGGGSNGGKAPTKKATLDEFKAMGSDQRTAIFKDDPDHFKQLNSQLKQSRF